MTAGSGLTPDRSTLSPERQAWWTAHPDNQGQHRGWFKQAQRAPKVRGDGTEAPEVEDGQGTAAAPGGTPILPADGTAAAPGGTSVAAGAGANALGIADPYGGAAFAAAKAAREAQLAKAWDDTAMRAVAMRELIRRGPQNIGPQVMERLSAVDKEMLEGALRANRIDPRTWMEGIANTRFSNDPRQARRA